jgi:hypothetical protein
LAGVAEQLGCNPKTRVRSYMVDRVDHASTPCAHNGCIQISDSCMDTYRDIVLKYDWFMASQRETPGGEHDDVHGGSEDLKSLAVKSGASASRMPRFFVSNCWSLAEPAEDRSTRYAESILEPLCSGNTRLQV